MALFLRTAQNVLRKVLQNRQNEKPQTLGIGECHEETMNKVEWIRGNKICIRHTSWITGETTIRKYIVTEVDGNCLYVSGFKQPIDVGCNDSFDVALERAGLDYREWCKIISHK